MELRPLLEVLADALPGVALPSPEERITEAAALRDVAVFMPFPPFPPAAMERREPSRGLRDLVHSAIARVLERRSENVLRLGYKTAQGWQSGGAPVGAPQLALDVTTASAEVLLSEPFEQLLAAVGERAMLHLLSSCSLLLRLDGRCYLQLTGPPVIDLDQRQLAGLRLPCALPGNGAVLPASRVAAADAWGSAAAAQSSGAAPAHARPSSSVLDWVVPRWALLYAPRPQDGHVRLARGHALEEVAASMAAGRTRGRRLTAHIFGLPGGVGRGFSGSSGERRAHAQAFASAPRAAATPAAGAAKAAVAVSAAGVRKPTRTRRVPRLPPRLERLAPILGQLARRHARARYDRLLEACCPQPSVEGALGAPDGSEGGGGACCSDVRGASGAAGGRAALQLPRRVPTAELPATLRRHALDSGYLSQCEEDGSLADAPRALMPSRGAQKALGTRLPVHLTAAPLAATCAAGGQVLPGSSTRLEPEAGQRAGRARLEAKSERAHPSRTPHPAGALEHLVSLRTPAAQVSRLAVAICQRVVPRALVGSGHNWRLLLRAARRLVTEPRRSLPSGRVLICKMRMADVPWLAKPKQRAGGTCAALPARAPGVRATASAPRRGPAHAAVASAAAAPERGRIERSAQRPCAEALARVLLWVLSRLVLPLLRSSFYATEASGGAPAGGDLVFFRHALWEQIRACALRSGALGLRLCRLDSPAARALLSDAAAQPDGSAAANPAPKPPLASLGVSALRFQPKPNGLRPISRLSSPALQLPPAVCAAEASPGARPTRAPLPSATATHAAHERAGSGRAVGARPDGVPMLEPVNLQLRDAFAVLRAEVERRPALLANSVLGLSGVQQRLAQLAVAARSAASPAAAPACAASACAAPRLQVGAGRVGPQPGVPRLALPAASQPRRRGSLRTELSSRTDELPELHFVSADAHACFDTIEHARLLRTLDGVLAASTYVVRQYGTLRPSALAPCSAAARSEGRGGAGREQCGGSAPIPQSGARKRQQPGSWPQQPARRAFKWMASPVDAYASLPTAAELRSLVGASRPAHRVEALPSGAGCGHCDAAQRPTGPDHNQHARATPAGRDAGGAGGGSWGWSEPAAASAAPAIVVDLARARPVPRSHCMHMLTQHVTRNLLTPNPRALRGAACRGARARDGTAFGTAAPLTLSSVYLQTCGIAQGSCVSALLCSLHYAELDRQHLARFSDLPTLRLPSLGQQPAHPNGVARARWAPAVASAGPTIGDGAREANLTAAVSAQAEAASATCAPRTVVRLIDDFLCASSEPSECAAFLARMHAGFPEYGCEANLAKSRAAPTAALRAELRGSVCEAGFTEPSTGQTFFAWCGLLISSRGPLVQKDYSTWAARGAAADLRYNGAAASGAQLAAKLRQTVIVRCHPIFADPRLTDERTALLNYYQASTFAALRLVVLVRQLPHVNERFVAELVRNAVAFGASLVARARKGLGGCSNAPTAVLARWLGLTAFARVLRRRQPSMSRVIADLDSSLRAPQMIAAMVAHAELLHAASNDMLHSARALHDARLSR